MSEQEIAVGREAAARRDWGAAFVALAAADEEGPLAAEDLEVLGEAAFWTGSYYKFTDAGAKNVKGTVQRARESRAENEQRGFTVHGLYWTQGQYDMVAVVEAPDEQAMLAGLFNIAGAGNVRSETLRAFTEAEMAQVIQKM